MHQWAVWPSITTERRSKRCVLCIVRRIAQQSVKLQQIALLINPNHHDAAIRRSQTRFITHVLSRVWPFPRLWVG